MPYWTDIFLSDMAGPPPRRAARGALAHLAPGAAGRAYEAGGGGAAFSEAGPFAAHGGGDPQPRIYRRRADEPWRALGDGLPEPLPAMPYALVAGDGRLFAGLADGQIWESGDRGDSWRACDPITALHALAYAAPEPWPPRPVG